MVTMLTDQFSSLPYRGVDVVLLGLGGSWGDTVCGPKVK